MGQAQKIHAEANAGNTSGPHDESLHGGAGGAATMWRGVAEGRPTSCGPLGFAAFASACTVWF